MTFFTSFIYAVFVTNSNMIPIQLICIDPKIIYLIYQKLKTLQILHVVYLSDSFSFNISWGYQKSCKIAPPVGINIYAVFGMFTNNRCK